MQQVVSESTAATTCWVGLFLLFTVRKQRRWVYNSIGVAYLRTPRQGVTSNLIFHTFSSVPVYVVQQNEKKGGGAWIYEWIYFLYAYAPGGASPTTAISHQSISLLTHQLTVSWAGTSESGELRVEAVNYIIHILPGTYIPGTKYFTKCFVLRTYCCTAV